MRSSRRNFLTATAGICLSGRSAEGGLLGFRRKRNMVCADGDSSRPQPTGCAEFDFSDVETAKGRIPKATAEQNKSLIANRDLSCYGKPTWQYQFSLEPNKQDRLWMSLSNPRGNINMGWGQHGDVYSDGQFKHDGAYVRASSAFPKSGWNAYCFVVLIREIVQTNPTKYYHWYLLNEGLGPGGASASEKNSTAYWSIRPNYFSLRREVWVHFNDEDTPNKGRFDQRFRAWY